MGSRLVRQPNGMLARFSDFVNDFTDCDMTSDEAIEEFAVAYGRGTARWMIKRADEKPNRFEEAIRIIAEVHGQEKADERRKQLSASPVLITEDNVPKAPVWHPRPTCPGLWACLGETPVKNLRAFGDIVQCTVLDLSQLDLNRGAPFHTSVCYGPIPRPETLLKAEAEIAIAQKIAYQLSAEGKSATQGEVCENQDR